MGFQIGMGGAQGVKGSEVVSAEKIVLELFFLQMPEKEIGLFEFGE
jgi:hypothetical protein